MEDFFIKKKKVQRERERGKKRGKKNGKWKMDSVGGRGKGEWGNYVARKRKRKSFIV